MISNLKKIWNSLKPEKFDLNSEEIKSIESEIKNAKDRNELDLIERKISSFFKSNTDKISMADCMSLSVRFSTMIEERMENVK